MRCVLLHRYDVLGDDLSAVLTGPQKVTILFGEIFTEMLLSAMVYNPASGEMYTECAPLELQRGDVVIQCGHR